MWVSPKFVLVYEFIMQVLYVMCIGTIGILYHDMGIVMGIQSHNIDFKGTMYVLHLGFLFNEK
jgi:Fe2+ transport system protein B